ncbi:MAG TPA: hypothetical protein DCM08_13705 [Microscillaceae bacterium]|jgi:hypothetical protein|nr:hypothetical protein [Microscillaceae bacterium]
MVFRFIRCYILFVLMSWLVLPPHGLAQSPLNLPFFDDFSGTPTTVDTSRRWLPNGGTYVTNQAGMNPPSLNAVTFDGQNGNGAPYNFLLPLAKGLADQLISRPINLSTLTPANQVFLSFYYQVSNNEEMPDTEDSLRVQFLDNTGLWTSVWSVRGGVPMANFIQVLVPVDQARWFHAGFQFRFQSFGRLSGPYDVWHVDYVLLNSGRSAGDVTRRDIACVRPPTSLLRRYTAMPIDQFLVNPSNELNPTLNTTINNLNNVFNVISYNCALSDSLTNTNYGLLPGGTFLINGATNGINLGVNLNPALIPNTLTPKIIKYKFNVLTGDNNTTIPPVDLRINDTITGFTSLQDYYAYDDGTAEYAAGVNQRFGRVAVRYVLSKPDTITAVRINFVRMETSLVGENIVLFVWKRLDNQASSQLYAKSYPVNYPPGRNNFITLTLDTPISLTDTFYVGYQQTSDLRLTVGFDRNNDASNNTFFSLNLGRNWSASEERGALLLRPVFSPVPFQPVTSLPLVPTLENDSLKVYPNPVRDILKISGVEVKSLHWVDMQGRVVLVQDNLQAIDVLYQEVAVPASLPKGLYVVYFTTHDKRRLVRKIIIE